ncbi:Glutaredoxin [Marinococcus luteus]|uniref:Glutaredoxin n=1 Tax=Marinococcus luteus TaxID=1122204 RepID=A0A1H2V6K5_9BACI|nr:glutaredoxin domain-containing protein [Marinococcus luteus]SDW63539.1 Glutaredoxin [Marinococcus luteus]
MVTLYTIDGCQDCWHWREMLEKNHISFREKNLFTDKQAVNDLLASIGEVKAPVLLCRKKQIPLSSVLASHC